MYELRYHPRTVKQARRLPNIEKEKVITEIKKLTKDPYGASLNIKKLVNTRRSYRLRVGDIRVIYEIDQKSQTVYIQEIGYRGQIY